MLSAPQPANHDVLACDRRPKFRSSREAWPSTWRRRGRTTARGGCGPATRRRRALGALGGVAGSRVRNPEKGGDLYGSRRPEAGLGIGEVLAWGWRLGLQKWLRADHFLGKGFGGFNYGAGGVSPMVQNRGGGVGATLLWPRYFA